MGIRFPKKNNPYYPLPSDYPKLGNRAQKMARLNAVRLQETPDDFVRAWAFFRSYYIQHQAHGFYPHKVVPSPLCHYEWIRDMARYPKNAIGAPRGSAKSVIMAQELPLFVAVTRPYFSTLLIFSGGRFVRNRFDLLMNQLEHNDRIIDDFGVQKPKRGSGIWNHSALKTMNGSGIYGIPIGGVAPGERPNLLIFDDVEYDPALVHQPTEKTELMERFMMNVAAPMMEEGSCMALIGTLHRRDFYLYHLCTTDDERYNSWNRMVYTAHEPDCEPWDASKFLWKEKLSPTFLEEKRKEMGASAYAANYLNQPGTEASRILVIHPELCQYSTREEDGSMAAEPLQSDAKLCSWTKVGTDPDSGKPLCQKLSRPFGEVVSKMYRIATLDYARTITKMSDFSCICIMGFENSPEYKDTLWVLDLFLGKVKDDTLIRLMWDMARKWQVQAVGVEAVSIQQQLVDRIATDFADWGHGGWLPRVLPIRYPTSVSKADRICGLEWRFNRGLIKLPMDRRGTWPFRELYRQIDNATEDLALLQHDDAVDALAMNMYVVRPRRKGTEGYETILKPTNPVEMLAAGDLHFENGIPVISGLISGELTGELVDKMRQHRYEAESDPGKKLTTWITPGGGA